MKKCNAYLFHYDCQCPSGHKGPHSILVKGSPYGREQRYDSPTDTIDLQVTWEEVRPLTQMTYSELP